MKKRLFVGLLCLILAMICVLAFGACDDGDDGNKTIACTHGQMTWIDEVSASCTATGTVGHYHCAECGKNFDANRVEIADLTIPFAHNPGADWLTENDKHYHACLNGCGTKLDETYCFGSLHYTDAGHWITCEVCGMDTALVSHDHTAKVVINLASCTEGGYTTYTCVCGHSYIDDETKANDHTYSEAWEKDDSHHWHPADCGCEGERSKYEKHSYQAVVTEPGCETQGYTTYTCECGDSYVSDYVDAKGHQVSEWIETASVLFDASKCEYRVSYRGNCSTCHTEQSKTEQVERHALFDRVIQSATCKVAGTKGIFCSSEACKYHNNAYRVENYHDETAHVWVEDSKNSDPENGVTAYRCDVSNCPATKKIASGISAGVSKEELDHVSEIELPDATIGIDQGVKDAINEAIKDAGGQSNVSISAGVIEGDGKNTVINNANLTPQEKELLGDGKIYSFTITTGSNQEIGSFGVGKATVRIRYDLQKDDDPNHIIVWYISKGELVAVEAVYSEDANGDGYVTFQTNHFSYYTVTQIEPQLLCEKLKKHSEKHLYVVEPTCITDGYTICLRCGKEVEGTRVKAHGHTMGATVVSEASCAQHGLTRYACANCPLSYEAITPATGHYHVLDNQVTATCKTHGSVTYSCVHCDDTYTKTTPKLNHVYHTTIIEPTCESVGYTEKTCTRCGEVANSKYTPAVGHSQSDVWYMNENGHYHLCTVCGEKMSEEKHTPGPAATEQSAQICTVCEYTIAPPVVHTHSLNKVAAQEATCTLGGNIEYYVCTCGSWFKDAAATMAITDHALVFVDAKGHTRENKGAVEPTCDEVGYTAGVWCSTCQTYLRGHIEISAYGHDYHEITKAPTCTEKGSVTYTCSYCGDVDTANSHELKALGHNTITVVTAPTCTDGGYTTTTCTRCKQSERTNETEALDHKLSGAYLTNEKGHWHACVRCDATGDVEAHTPDYQQATTDHGIKCVVCGYVIAEALEHTHAADHAVEAADSTCTVSGNIAYYICSCGDWFYDRDCKQPIYDRASVIIKPMGHTLTYHATQQPTCTALGYTSGAYCEICDTWFTGHEEIAMIDHIYAKAFQHDAKGHWHQCLNCDATTKAEEHQCGAIVTAPTCSEKGYTTYTCADCGYSYTTDETDAVAHEYERGRCKWCGEAEPVDPSKPAVLYTWEQISNDGSKMVYLFYSNGEVIATYQDMSMTAYWIEKDGFVFLYEDAAHTKSLGKATINADGTVTPWQCTDHKYVLIDKQDATCTEGAYEEYECTECGNRYGNGSGPLGHEFGTDGLCIRCKKTEEEINGSGDFIKPDAGQLEKYKIETLSRMAEEWKRAISRNPAAEEAFDAQYQDICTMIQNAKEIGEVDDIYNHYFRSIIEQIGSVDIVEEYRQNVLVNMENEWKETATNASVEATYKAQYERIRSMMQKASTVEEIDELYHGQFRSMINQILGQGEEPSDKPVYTYVHHLYDAYGTIVSKMDFKFYKDGTVIVRDEKHEGVVYWNEQNGIVSIYRNEMMTERVATLRIDDDGQLSDYTCEEHELELIVTNEPTCMSDGCYVYRCCNCGYVEEQTILSNPDYHEYKDGYCNWCGVSDGSDVDDTPIIDSEYSLKYVHRYEGEDGCVYHEIYLCLNNGTVDARIYRDGKLLDQATFYWINDGFSVRISTDENYKEVIGAFTIGDDGTTLIPLECKKHSYVVVDKKEATCTEDGYCRQQCIYCGGRSESFTQALGHDYANGICTRCGGTEGEADSDPDFEKYKAEILAQMENEWNQASILNMATAEALRLQYRELCAMVQKAMSDDEIDELYHGRFQDLLDRIYSQGGSEEGLEEYRSEILEHMRNDWMKAVPDASVEAAYMPQYKELCAMVEQASSIEEIEAIYYERFQKLLDTVRNQGGSSEPEIDLEAYRSEIIEQMETQWMKFSSNATLMTKYEPQYEEYREMVKSAESIEEMNEIYNGAFKTLIEKLNDQSEKPVLPTVVYTGEQVLPNGNKLTYCFYSNGEVIATYQDMSMTAYWIERDGFVYIYEDAEHTVFGGKAIINEDGTITLVDCGEDHSYVLIEQRDATCTEGAYEAYGCTECGYSYTHRGSPLGHEYGEDGYCGRCGVHMNQVNPELDAYKEEIKAQMYKEFMTVVNSVEMQEKYQAQFDMLCEQVANATSVKAIDNVYSGKFKDLINTILAGGEQSEISYIEHPFGDFSAMVGQNVEEFIEKNLLYHDLYVYYTDGAMTSMSITRDMIDTMGQDFSSLGTVFFYIRYEGHEVSVYICVDGGCVHENQNVETVPSTSCISVGYERTVCLDCGEVIRYLHLDTLPHSYVDGKCEWCGVANDDNLESTRQSILNQMKEEWDRFLISGTTILPSHQKKFDALIQQIESATNERTIINLYNNDYTKLLESVHSGTDVEGCSHVKQMTEVEEATCTKNGFVKTFCAECGEQLSYDSIFATGHHYDENGYCMDCGIHYGEEIEPRPEEPDLPTFVTVTDISIDFPTQYSVTVGEDVEAFIEKYLIGQKIIVTYSDETTKIVFVTRDMIDTQNETFDSMGTVTFFLAYSESYSNFNTSIRIQVIKDLSNEKLMGIYTFDATQMGGTMLEIRVYESGLASSDTDGNLLVGEYRLEGSLLYVTFNDMTIVFSVGKDNVLTMYQPTQSVIGVYHYQILTITVYGTYTSAGEYIAVFENGGTMSMTTVVTLDLEKAQISSSMIGGTLDIDENGGIYCDHQYEVIETREATCTESGYQTERCVKCNASRGYDQAPLGHSYDANGVCIRCDKNGDGENGSDDSGEEIVVVETLYGFDRYQEVTKGSDVEKFLNEVFVGSWIQLRYADGTVKTLTVTRDMINANDLSLDKVGYYQISILYLAENGCEREIWVDIQVTVDFSNAKELGTYFFEHSEAALALNLYDNGYADVTIFFEDGTENTTAPYTLSGNLLYLSWNNVTVVLVLNEDGMAEIYVPTTKPIASYTYHDATIDVYGPYMGAGEYIAVAYDGEEILSALVSLDLENGTIYIPMFSRGELTIDEDGSLFCNHEYQIYDRAPTCREPGYHDEQCTLCGESTITSIPKLDHVYGEDGLCVSCGLKEGIENDFIIVPDSGFSKDDTYFDTNVDGDYTYSDFIVDENGNVAYIPTFTENAYTSVDSDASGNGTLVYAPVTNDSTNSTVTYVYTAA